MRAAPAGAPRAHDHHAEGRLGSREKTVTETLLSATHLAKSYRSRKVVQDLSLEVRAGEIVGLLGPNGAGKTTAFYMIVGLVPCDAGRITLGDQDLTFAPVHRRARAGLGYLPQEPSVFRKLSVENNVMAILETRGGSDARKPARSAWRSCWRISASATCATAWGCRCPVASGAGWRSPGRWRPIPASSCWMSPSPASTRYRCWISSASSATSRRAASAC